MLLQTSSNEVLLGRLCHLAAIFATPPGSYFGPPRPGSIKMNRRRGRTSLFNGHLDIKTACEESNMINKKKTLKKFGDRKIRIKQPPLTGYNLCTSAVSQQQLLLLRNPECCGVMRSAQPTTILQVYCLIFQ